MATESCRWLTRRYPDRSRVIREIFRYSAGVHLLHQPILETVVGYLLSVQSTVALVSSRLERIARLFPPQRSVLEGQECYFFPTAEQLRSIPTSTLEDLRLGYRQPWLEKLIEHLPDEHQLAQLSSATMQERQGFFREFEGIGPKVAACIDLFAYGNTSAFPIDVWVERGLRAILGFRDAEIAQVRRNPSPMLGPWCGLFGEYLFRYERGRSA